MLPLRVVGEWCKPHRAIYFVERVLLNGDSRREVGEEYGLTDTAVGHEIQWVGRSSQAQRLYHLAHGSTAFDLLKELFATKGYDFKDYSLSAIRQINHCH